MSAVYNFQDVVLGSTLEERVFVIKRYVGGTLKTLSGTTIRFQVFRSSTSRIYIDKSTGGNGITIHDAGACLFSILPISTEDLTEAKYYWHLLIEYPDGSKKIPLGGELNIVTIKEFADV